MGVPVLLHWDDRRRPSGYGLEALPQARHYPPAEEPVPQVADLSRAQVARSAVFADLHLYRPDPRLEGQGEARRNGWEVEPGRGASLPRGGQLLLRNRLGVSGLE